MTVLEPTGMPKSGAGGSPSSSMTTSWWQYARRLDEVSGDRDNNFNLLRVIAAVLVLFSHSFTLVSGNSSNEPLRQSLDTTWGAIAVDVFFITSGFLITASLVNRNDIVSFSIARIRRIYPALIAAMTVTVFGIGLALTTMDRTDYLLSRQTYRYWFFNSTLVGGVEGQLPGVFGSNPFGPLVNGSLWTLPYEVKAYALMAFVWLASRAVGRRRENTFFVPSVVLLGAVGLLCNMFNSVLPLLNELGTRLYGFFFLGAACFVLRSHITLSTKLFTGIAALVLACTQDPDMFGAFYPPGVAYITFYLAYGPGGRLRQFNQLGDYSYGLYIYAFPVQQSLIALFPSMSTATMVVYSFAVTLGLAVISWHVVEGPSLKGSRRP